MTNRNLVILAVVAAALGGAAWYLGGDAKRSAPALNGRTVLPGLDLASVAKVEFGDRLKIASGDDGWKVESYHGYPVDPAKLTENLLKLTELRVGQVARGKKLDSTRDLVLRDASGGEVARLPLGERHAKWSHGRYASFAGQTVLVSDTLDAFDGDGREFVETKIVDEPWISFKDVVENVSAEDLGFATGVVAKVTIAGDTNRTVTVGNVVKGSSDRYLKLDNADWIFTVPSYSVEKLLPKDPAEP